MVDPAGNVLPEAADEVDACAFFFSFYQFGALKCAEQQQLV